MKTLLLYLVTAIAEIVGCHLSYLWLKENKSVWLLIPAVISFGLFAWLLTLHGNATGRVYAAYGAIYIGTAVAWLWAVNGVVPTRWDLIGAAVALAGTAIIVFQPK